MARLLVQTTLPHSRQPSKTFVRTNGALQVAVSAHPLLELPYGRYPRLLMAWVTTEAVRTKDPVLELGPSLTSFMSQLVSTPLFNRLFRDPGGRSRAEAEMRRIGNNLNRLNRVANVTGRIDQTKRLKAVLYELTKAIRRLAWPQPH